MKLVFAVLIAAAGAISVNRPSARVSGEEGIYRQRPYTYTYNDIIFNTTSGIFEGGGNFNHVDISGTAGEYMRFESGMTFVINDLVGTGTRHEPLNLEASVPGNEAYIEQSSGDVTLEYVLLQDMHVSGGANFTADQSEDHGNNVGWNMIPIVALEY